MVDVKNGELIAKERSRALNMGSDCTNTTWCTWLTVTAQDGEEKIKFELAARLRVTFGHFVGQIMDRLINTWTRSGSYDAKHSAQCFHA